VGNTLYFAANDGSSGFELWAYESATTPQVANLLPPVLVLSRDTGSVAHVTRNGRIQISGLQDAASWQYRIRTNSLRGGWIDGTSFTLTLAADANDRVVARQVDAVGNRSANSNAIEFTLDTTPPDPLISHLGLSIPSGFQITTADNGRTLSGSGTDRNADVLISHGDRRLLTIRSNHTGMFSHTFTASEIERISQETQSFSVRQVDRAGNRAESSTKTAFVNTTTGSDRLDILTSMRVSRDVFAWESLQDSLLRRFDTITIMNRMTAYVSLLNEASRSSIHP